MKIKTITLLLFFPYFSFSQTYDLDDHPLCSKVWKSERVFDDGDQYTLFIPIEGGSFDYDLTYVQNNLNEIKINNYLLESFNEFRKDYGLCLVAEDSNVSKNCREYSKFRNGFVHDKNKPKNQSECIASVPFIMLTKIKKEQGDINKIISECCFDIFVGCPSHMSLLCDPKAKIFGFGVVVENEKLNVVVRGVY